MKLKRPHRDRRLKPCPFCASEWSELTIAEVDEAPGFIEVICGGCGCIGPWAKTIGAVRARWNSRKATVKN